MWYLGKLSLSLCWEVLVPSLLGCWVWMPFVSIDAQLPTSLVLMPLTPQYWCLGHQSLLFQLVPWVLFTWVLSCDCGPGALFWFVGSMRVYPKVLGPTHSLYRYITIFLKESARLAHIKLQI